MREAADAPYRAPADVLASYRERAAEIENRARELHRAHYAEAEEE